MGGDKKRHFGIMSCSLVTSAPMGESDTKTQRQDDSGVCVRVAGTTRPGERERHNERKRERRRERERGRAAQREQITGDTESGNRGFWRKPFPRRRQRHSLGFLSHQSF